MTATIPIIRHSRPPSAHRTSQLVVRMLAPTSGRYWGRMRSGPRSLGDESGLEFLHHFQFSPKLIFGQYFSASSHGHGAAARCAAIWLFSTGLVLRVSRFNDTTILRITNDLWESNVIKATNHNDLCYFEVDY
jgi:hypothetical protein